MGDSSSDGPAAADDVPVISGLGELAELVGGRERLYLRYSHGPELGPEAASFDYESGLELSGLSATVLTPEAWWTRPVEDWLARQVRKYAPLAEEDPSRRGWVLQGRVAARGPDHEPLLVDIRPVASLTASVMDESRRRYRERFSQGRTSNDGE